MFCISIICADISPCLNYGCEIVGEQCQCNWSNSCPLVEFPFLTMDECQNGLKGILVVQLATHMHICTHMHTHVWGNNDILSIPFMQHQFVKMLNVLLNLPALTVHTMSQVPKFLGSVVQWKEFVCVTQTFAPRSQTALTILNQL